ncbi:MULTISPECIES: hypothetical protein [Pseudomonadota]|jgi:hypothetical protein|uniref:hypothetical protein n=1 Tax=Pseudomonadota TaxID=1224 RepID=UPI0008328C95|nr:MULTISPECIES: hypothetical protein [Pseudomonadota]|tara:strand:- start:167589 stop:168428 length:840 start_codon:yes stop_codon:yes gene_type:complete
MPHALKSLAAATALTVAISGGFPIVYGANAQVSSETEGPGYVALARLADAAPQVLRVQVKKTTVVDPARAPDVAPTMARLFVEAQVLNLIRGKQGVSESIRYLVDVPRNAKGNVPKLKKQQFLLFARPGTRAGEVQLVSKDAQVAWTAATEQQVRTIVTELVSTGAPPAIKGIREALHVRGNLQGEGETQVFLATSTGDPVSITVLRRPGLAPRWAVSLTEIVDEAAAPPKRDTLLWYRLACFLPREIPARALVSDTPADNDLARRDYNFVLEQLGPCR